MVYHFSGGSTCECWENLLQVATWSGTGKRGKSSLWASSEGKWRYRWPHSYMGEKQGRTSVLSRESFKWSFEVDMYTEAIEKKSCVVFILYRVRQINQQQNHLDDCYLVYTCFKPVTPDEALLASWIKFHNGLSGSGTEKCDGSAGNCFIWQKIKLWLERGFTEHHATFSVFQWSRALI